MLFIFHASDFSFMSFVKLCKKKENFTNYAILSQFRKSHDLEILEPLSKVTEIQRYSSQTDKDVGFFNVHFHKQMYGGNAA